MEGDATKREHFKQAEKRGANIPELHATPPAGTEYLWEWYCDIASSDAGFSYTEIYAWAVLRGQTLRSWEIKTLRRLDIEKRRVSSG